MKLVLNEKKILDRALQEGVIEKKITTTLRVLAKYYFSKGQNKTQVTSSLDNFMSNNYKGYVFIKWREAMKRVVNRIYKKKDYDLLCINCINIYKTELNTIKSINNTKLERLAFALLVYARLFNSINKKERNWVNASLKEIAEDTVMGISEIDCALMINKLYNMNLVQPSRMANSTDVKILFADTSGDVAFKVEDFDNLILYYQKYIGDNIGNCEVCGKMIELTSNRKKYCAECWRKIREKQNRDNFRVWYKKRDLIN